MFVCVYGAVSYAKTRVDTRFIHVREREKRERERPTTIEQRRNSTKMYATHTRH